MKIFFITIIVTLCLSSVAVSTIDRESFEPVSSEETVIETQSNTETIENIEIIETQPEILETETTPEETAPPTPIKLTLEEVEKDWKREAIYLAKTVWGEGRGTSKKNQEQVMWCILNRVDHKNFGDTVVQVVTSPGAFYGYNKNNPVEEEMYIMALDVISRWLFEKEGGESFRTLEKGYVYFSGNGKENIFRKKY